MPTGLLFITALQEVTAPNRYSTQVIQDRAPFAEAANADVRRRSHVYAPRPAALAVTVAGPAVTPRPQQLVEDQAALFWRRQQHRGRVIQGRWAGYQWVGLPPIPPLPKQVVVDDAVWTAGAQKNRARRPHIYQQRTIAEQTFATPTKSIVVGQAEQTAIRRAHHGSVVQSRWPGYQWVGLPPVTPTPKQLVQDKAAIWQARQDHRRGLVIEPGVQAAAAAAGIAPVVPPLPKQVVQDQAGFAPRRVQRGGRIIEPGVQLAAASAPVAPVVTPLPRQIVILARATPRQKRGGHIIQPRMIQAPVTPPRPIVIDLCPATTRRARGGHIIIGRPNTSPVTPPRPQRPTQAHQRRRQRFGRVSRWDRQRFGTGIGPPPSTLITTPATGYVSVGDVGLIAAGATAPLPPSLLLAPSSTLTPGSDTVESPSSSGQVVAGSTATPLAGASGIVRV